jgi:DNA modification methylase
MANDAADLIFTDPPYNVDYEGYTEDRLKIKGDRMSDAEFKKFLEAAFRSCRCVVKPGASLYVCHSSSWQREFQNALESAGFEVRCQIIWAKNTFAWGFGRYKFHIVLCPRRRAEGSLVRRQVSIDAMAGEQARG